MLCIHGLAKLEDLYNILLDVFLSFFGAVKSFETRFTSQLSTVQIDPYIRPRVQPKKVKLSQNLTDALFLVSLD